MKGTLNVYNLLDSTKDRVLNTINLEDLHSYIGKEIDVKQTQGINNLYILLIDAHVKINKIGNVSIRGKLKRYSNKEIKPYYTNQTVLYNEPHGK